MKKLNTSKITLASALPERRQILPFSLEHQVAVTFVYLFLPYRAKESSPATLSSHSWASEQEPWGTWAVLLHVANERLETSLPEHLLPGA